MKRKVLAVILSTAMAAALAGCAGNGKAAQDNSKQGESVKAENDGPMGKYDETVELSAVRYQADGIEFAEGESIENNVWSKAYEDELNIKLDYLWTTPQSQYAQKLNASIVTEVPDLMWVDAGQMKRMVEDDMLADLTDIYGTYKADFTDKVLHDDGGSAMESATFDGKLYGLPHIQSGYGSTEVLWIRTDWLEKLNLKAPESMDDVIKIAEAFANEDPDGNGTKDTYGLAVNKGLVAQNNLPYGVLDGFFNGYHAYPTIWVNDDSNNLVYGGVQPEMKEALRELQDLYKNGAIDMEFGVKDAAKVSEDVNSGKAGMFYGYFWNCGSGWLQDGVVSNPDAEWKPFSIVSSDKEPAKVMAPFATTYYTVVSKDCKNPEAAIKMYNLVLEKNFGDTAEPSVYNVNKDNVAVFNYAYTYGEPPMKNLDAQKKVTEALESEDTSALNPEEIGYYDNCKNYLDGDMNAWGNYMMYGPESGMSVINDYVSEDRVLIDQYFGAPTDSMAEKNATLEKLQLETFTKIITGNADIDEFDNFVENWEKLGGTTITEEVNDWLENR